jgi:hypothetical protein
MRSYEAVREGIDARLGSGVGLSAAQAALELTPVEHVVWALDNLLANLFEFRLHLWHQGFTGAEYDGVRIISVIAEQARSIDPLIADLLRWTARWVATRSVPMASLVPELWAAHGKAAQRFLMEVAATWPEALHPASLPEPAPFVRVPSSGPVAVGFTPAGATCAAQCPVADQHREGVFRAVLSALWQAGAEDQTLDDFFAAYFQHEVEEVEVVCRFISFDGDGGDDERKAALQRSIRPISKLAKWLGVASVPLPAIIRVDSLGQLDGLLDDWRAEWCEGPSLLESARRALRTDPDAIVLDAALLQPGQAEWFVNVPFTGHLLVAAGESVVKDELVRKADSVPLFDRRRRN